MENKEQKILAMVSAVSEILKLKNQLNTVDEVVLMRAFSNFLGTVKNKNLKLVMILSATKTISTLQKEKLPKDKEILRKIVSELPALLEKAEAEENLQVVKE